MAWVPAEGAALEACLERLREAARATPRFEPPENPRAMQITLRLPKAMDERPPRSEVLAAAALAVGKLCLDARVAPGGEWHEDFAAWIDTQMRKVARRARGGQWDATAGLAGVEACAGGAVARAFVPQPLDAVDPLVQRLQVGGTDAPADVGSAPVPEAGIEILVDGGLEMSAGKAAAQAGHGIMLVLAEMPRARVEEWLRAGMPLVARRAEPERWATVVAAVDAGVPGYAGVRDAGYTEVAPGSLTVVAIDAVTAEGGVGGVGGAGSAVTAEDGAGGAGGAGGA